MLGNLLALSLGLLLIAGGIFGRRFTVGLSGKIKAFPWYGRAWLIGNGLFLLAAGGTGIVRVLYPQSPLLEHAAFFNKAQCNSYAIFESYNGIGLAIGGLIGAVYFFRKQDWKSFWLSLAFIVGGAIFGYDGIWSLFKGCSPQFR